MRKDRVEENESEDGEKKRADERIGLKEGENEPIEVAQKVIRLVFLGFGGLPEIF